MRKRQRCVCDTAVGQQLAVHTLNSATPHFATLHRHHQVSVKVRQLTSNIGLAYDYYDLKFCKVGLVCIACVCV